MKKISSLEYNTLAWFIIRASYVGLSVKNVLILSKQDAWISAALALLLGFIPLMVFIYLRGYDGKMNILELNESIFGTFGKFINILLGIGSLLLVLVSFLDLTHFINSQFLFKTKYIYISICFIIPLIYALYKGINAIARTSLMLFYFVIAAILVMLLGIMNDISIENIKPIFNTDKTSLVYGSLLLIAYSVLPLLLLLIIPKEKINNYKVKNSILFYVLSMLTLVNAMFIIISVFGPDLALLYDYPEFHLLKKVKIGEFVDRLENLLSLEWVVGLFILIVMGTYFSLKVINRLFNLKEKTSKIVGVFTCLGILVISQFSLAFNESISQFIENGMVPILYFCFFVLPLITMIGTFLKKIKG